ncbi:MAG: hypothetical protein NVS9B10_25300 [Nevskia sp.]
MIGHHNDKIIVPQPLGETVPGELIMAGTRRTLLPAALLLIASLLAACSDSAPTASGTTTGGTTTGGATTGGTTGSPPPTAAADLFLNVLPPGANGNSAGGVGAPVPGLPIVRYPDNFMDQLALYGDLSYAQQGLKSAPCTPPNNSGEHQAASDQACNYYKSEGLDPVPGTVVSTTALTAPGGRHVTIQRDQWGVPYINGDDRGAAMYAFGYVSAEDRLWLHDVLRNIGRGRFSEYLGPAADTLAFDANLAVVAGYEEAELTAMIELARRRFGTLGDQAVADVDNMVAGINAYIDSLSGANVAKIPPEYASLRLPGISPLVSLPFPPRHWTRNDIVASAILIQSIFATGGGGEPTAELLLQRLDPSFGPGATSVPKAACEFWRDVRHADDPDATRTIETAFATQSPASVSEACPQALPAGTAIWDVGSLQARAVLTSGGAALPSPALPAATVRAPLAPGLGGPQIFSLPRLFGGLPAVVETVLQRISLTLTPLALFSVGLQLHFEGLRSKLPKIALGLSWKMALAPLLAFGIAGLLGVRGTAATAGILQCAMAPMITAGIVAEQHGLDPPLANLVVGVGTLLSLVTIPLASWLL